MNSFDPRVISEQLRHMAEHERHMLAGLLKRVPAVRNTNQEFDEQLTLGQRLADQVASFGGSWTFIGLFLTGMMAWMLVNSVMSRPFDPFPYILLNLVLSCLAALQAPVIMMSQNRQAAHDRLDAQHDYEVNLKAEVEIMNLHAKMDNLREQQWSELLLIQREQLALLQRLVQRLEQRESA